MTKTERCEDIGNRLSIAMAERSIQPKGTTAYDDLTKIINDIRKEYRNGSKTRIVMQYDKNKRKYYGLDMGL